MIADKNLEAETLTNNIHSLNEAINKKDAQIEELLEALKAKKDVSDSDDAGELPDNAKALIESASTIDTDEAREAIEALKAKGANAKGNTREFKALKDLVESQE